MRILVRSLLVVNAVGAVLAVRRHRPARFAGIAVPGSPIVHVSTIGSASSAPPVALVALLIAERRGRTDLVQVLSAMFFVGILGEPDTWAALRRPGAHPPTTACVALEIALPAALLLQCAELRSMGHRPGASLPRAVFRG